MTWPKLSRPVLIISIGALVNLLCFGYVVLGVSERGSLEREVKNLASNVNRLKSELPDSSGMMALSNRARVMRERTGRLKKQMVYDFENVASGDVNTPAVAVNDRTSFARKKIKEKFQSENRSFPPDSLGLPNEPESGRHLEQLRQIHAVQHIFDVLLKTQVTSVSGVKTSGRPSDHPLRKRLENIGDMKRLTPLLEVQFQSTLKKATAVLHSFQTAPNYMQIFSLNVSSGDTGTGQDRNTEPVLDVSVTVAPVYSGKKDDEDQSETEKAEDEEKEESPDEDGASSLFN